MHFRKLTTIGVIAMSLLLIVNSCGTSFHEQTMACYDEYSSKLDDCNGDEGCETEAVDDYQSCLGFEYQFPVNFIVLTDSLTGTSREIERELRDVIDSLNRYFTVQDNSLPPDNRRRVVTFTFKSVTHYDAAVAFGGDIVDFATPTFDFNERHDLQDLVNDPANSNLFDVEAINVFIVDCWRDNDSGVYSDISDSHAKNNNDQPYIVLDYARITGKSNRVAVEEHEMGHCFNLCHVCVPTATTSTSTNIMASAGDYPSDNAYEYGSGASVVDCTGSGGRRDIGFNAQQCRIILRNAEEIKIVLGL